MATEKELNVILQELVRRANDTLKRLRAVEERQRGIESRLNNLEETRLEEKRDFGEEIDELESKVNALNDKLLQTKAVLDRSRRRFDRFATKPELKELEANLDLLSPIKEQFVTRDEFRKFKRGKS